MTSRRHLDFGINLGLDGSENRLIGDDGDNRLTGRDGDDVYVYRRGDGAVTIYDTATDDEGTKIDGGSDTLIFGADITEEMLRVTY